MTDVPVPQAPSVVARRFTGWPSVLAVVTYLVGTPIAFAVTAAYDLYPFHNRAWGLSIVTAFLGITGLLALSWRRASETVAGLGAGLFAVWMVLTLRTAIDGTPFGFGGISDDAGRMSAAATRYSVTMAPSDALIPGLPPEQPPLFPWLIGRVSAILDIPAWQLVGDAQILCVSAAALVCFLLWRRLASGWVALAIAGLGVLVFGDPRKAYEVITLLAFIPWAVQALARPPSDSGSGRGRLHWLPAGIVGGLIVLTYQAWFIFGGLGLLAIIWTTWRTEPDRRGYLGHVAAVAAVAFVVDSWYLVPFLWGVLTRDSVMVSDLFSPVGIHGEMFPFLEPTPLGVVQLAGLVGLLWLRRTVWWAGPLLFLGTSAFVYRMVALVPYVPTGHTKFLQYSAHLYAATFAAA
ncbi:MAG TPA: arabinofuranosyltransferase, partial [Micromonosporaceae bacterium]|nr:arabinofuranosyltransferase [Micromonosporaceae bacterium]